MIDTRRLPSRIRVGITVVVTVLVVTSIVPTIGIASDIGAQRVSSGETPASAASIEQQMAISAQSSTLDYNGTTVTTASRANTSVSNVTLITGQTVRIIETPNDTLYEVESDEPMHKIETAEGTYIFPESVDFSTFHRSLFNVDLLVEQGLSDRTATEIPVIVTLENRTHRQRRSGMNTLDAKRRLMRADGYQFERTLATIDGVSGEISKERAASTARDFQNLDAVQNVYLDRAVQISLDEPVESIGGTRARSKYNITGENVTVAVIDTGIDKTHPDLDNSTVVLERDFTDDGTTDDLFGHGTHVAGIIAGDGDASNGTHVGVAPAADVINAKALNKQGWGRTSWIIKAIEYSVDNNADVISMSLGGSVRENDPLITATNWAADKGTVVVAAAGNSGQNGYFTITSPGAARQAITVGASNDARGTIASFSSRGPTPLSSLVKPNLVAPGVEITSARASGTSMGSPVSPHYTKASGTSMATPYVSGSAALVVAAHPNWTAQAVKSSLVTTTNSLSKDYNVYTAGTGQVNVSRAIDPAIRFNKGTLQYGLLNTTTERRVLRVTNHGNQTRHVRFNATAVDIVSHERGNVTTNRSNVTLRAGETAAVSVIVNASTDTGIFSGHFEILTDNSTYSLALGYTRGHEVTVTKESLNRTSVANDPVLLIPHNRDYQRFFGLRMKRVSSGSTTFFTFSGNYTVWSTGHAENTIGTGENDGIIMTSESVSINSATTVHLNESATVVYDLNNSRLTDRHGTLSNLSVQSDLQREFQHDDGSVSSVQWSYLNLFTKTQRVRFSKGAYNTKVEYWLVPRQYHNNTYRDGMHIDSPALYHLTYPTTGVTGPREFTVDYSRLATEQRRYRRSASGRTYTTEQFVDHDAWYGFDMAEPWKIRDRQQQTVYLTPDMEYRNHMNAFVSNPSWSLSGLSATRPGAGDTNRLDINRHPYTGDLWYWDLTDTGFTVEGASQVDQGASSFLYNNHQTSPMTAVFRNHSLVTNLSGEHFAYTDRVVNNPGTRVSVVSVSENPGRTLSSRTLTEWSATYSPNNDTAPPRITDIQVESANNTNTVLSGSTRVRVTVADNAAVNHVQLLVANENPAGRPWNGSNTAPGSGWSAVTATRVSANTYVATVNLDGGKTVHLGAAANDSYGNYVRTVSYDAVRVASTPAVVSVEGQTGIVPGENVTINVSARPNGAELYGAQFDLHYNETLLNVTGVDRGKLLRADGNNSSVIVNRVRSGRITYAETRRDTSTGVSQSGTLAQVTFHVPSGANKTATKLALQNVTLSDPAANKIDRRVENATLRRLPTTVALAPQKTTKLEPGETFSVQVVTDANGYEVFGAQATLEYNTSVLDVARVSGGNFLSKDGTQTVVVANETVRSTGTVKYAETRLGTSGVTGRGTLLNLTFRVAANASYGSATHLNLTNIKLSDPAANPLPVSTTNGSATLASSPLPDPNATLVTAANTVGAPLKVTANVSHIENLSRVELVHPNGTVLNTTQCSGKTCSTTLQTIPSKDSWNGTGYADRTYRVRVVTANNTTAANAVRTPVTIAGDATGDGAVNLFDAVLVGRHWKCYSGISCYSDRADLNNDRIVNVFDAVFVGINWQNTA